MLWRCGEWYIGTITVATFETVSQECLVVWSMLVERRAAPGNGKDLLSCFEWMVSHSSCITGYFGHAVVWVWSGSEIR